MQTPEFPFKSIVFVCTNTRASGERVACANAGQCGGKLRDLLKDQVAARGLKGKVRVSGSGCMDLCEQGPNVMVFNAAGERILYSGVAETDVPALLEKHFKA